MCSGSKEKVCGLALHLSGCMAMSAGKKFCLLRAAQKEVYSLAMHLSNRLAVNTGRDHAAHVGPGRGALPVQQLAWPSAPTRSTNAGS